MFLKKIFPTPRDERLGLSHGGGVIVHVPDVCLTSEVLLSILGNLAHATDGIGLTGFQNQDVPNDCWHPFRHAIYDGNGKATSGICGR
jgi:hypothetical protein